MIAYARRLITAPPEPCCRCWCCKIVVLIVAVVEEHHFLHPEECKTVGEDALEVGDAIQQSLTALLKVEVPRAVEWKRSTLLHVVYLAVDVHHIALLEVSEQRIKLSGYVALDVVVVPDNHVGILRHLLHASFGRSEIVVGSYSRVFEVGTVLFRLLQAETAVVYKVVDKCRSNSLLKPDTSTLLVLGATPTAVYDSVVVGSELCKRNNLAVAGIGQFEGIGASIVYYVVGNVEFATRLNVDSLATVCGIATVGKYAVVYHALTSCEISLVVVVVMYEAVCHYKLAVDVAEVEGRHAAVDGALEEVVLE